MSGVIHGGSFFVFCTHIFFDGWLWLLGGGAVAAITQENEAAYEVRKSSGEHFRTCAGVGGGVHVHEGRVFLRSKGEID